MQAWIERKGDRERERDRDKKRERQSARETGGGRERERVINGHSVVAALLKLPLLFRDQFL